MMRKLIYSMGTSFDGFIAGPGGEIEFSAPDEELHRFHNEQTREIGVQLCGRRLYEAMVCWETADRNPEASEVTVEFARIWQALPKIVFSKTLEAVEGNSALLREGVAEEVARLKREEGKDIAVGGGTPFLPALDQRIDLELVETRTFGSRVVYLRYRLAG
jgi:dihydrofolate reductase